MTSTTNDDTTIEIYRKVWKISVIGRHFAKFMSSLASVFFSFNHRLFKKGGIFASISNENSTPSASADEKQKRDLSAKVIYPKAKFPANFQIEWSDRRNSADACFFVLVCWSLSLFAVKYFSRIIKLCIYFFLHMVFVTKPQKIKFLLTGGSLCLNRQEWYKLKKCGSQSLLLTLWFCSSIVNQ